MKKQLLLALCALFVVVTSLDASCMGGSCGKKQRTEKVRGCKSGRCGK